MQVWFLTAHSNYHPHSFNQFARLGMSWQSSVRSLLRDLKRSKASTPSELQLEHLHVEVTESDEDIAWDNIHPVSDIIGNEKGRLSTFFMNLVLRDAETARFCSEYVAAALIEWITDLSRQTAEKIHIRR